MIRTAAVNQAETRAREKRHESIATTGRRSLPYRFRTHQQHGCDDLGIDGRADSWLLGCDTRLAGRGGGPAGGHRNRRTGDRGADRRQSLDRDASPFLPLLGTLFIFLVFANLSGIVPGVRAPTASIETPAALASIVFLSVHFYGVQVSGLRSVSERLPQAQSGSVAPQRPVRDYAVLLSGDAFVR